MVKFNISIWMTIVVIFLFVMVSGCGDSDDGTGDDYTVDDDNDYTPPNLGIRSLPNCK